MPRLLATDRLAPIVAGIAGLAWFWAELAPQRTGFEDTDNPATGLAFIAAHPEAWQQAGVALVVMALAFVATVFAIRDRLQAAAPAGASTLAVNVLSTVGLFGAAALLGMGFVRLSGGPVLYVRGLDEGWGEMAYTVTQFVGVQLLLVGGLALLAGWIVGVAVLGARRQAIPRATAFLAILPGARLLAIPMLSDLLPGAWIVLVVAIPAAFLWLVLLGAWRPSPGSERLGNPQPDPVAI